MASPQIEDGFYRIARELMPALLTARITHRARAVLMYVIHRTYGRDGIKQVPIDPLKLATLYGLRRTEVWKGIGELRQAEMIGWKDNRATFRKDYDRWRRPDGPMFSEQEKRLFLAYKDYATDSVPDQERSVPDMERSVSPSVPDMERERSGYGTQAFRIGNGRVPDPEQKIRETRQERDETESARPAADDWSGQLRRILDRFRQSHPDFVDAIENWRMTDFASDREIVALFRFGKLVPPLKREGWYITVLSDWRGPGRGIPPIPAEAGDAPATAPAAPRPSMYPNARTRTEELKAQILAKQRSESA